MAKDRTQASENQSPPAEQQKKPASMKKLIMIGVPVFLLQVVVLYFVATRYLAPSPASAETSKAAEHSERSENHEGAAEGFTQNIFVVKDIIVNPAGTNGTRFLLMTVGLEVSNPGAQKELESKEIQVRDALNTILSTKGLEELASTEHREGLRTEISGKVGDLLKSGTLTNVYFSKFIIQ